MAGADISMTGRGPNEHPICLVLKALQATTD